MICKEIGLTVLKHDTLAVVWDTIEDYFAFLFTPVSSFLTLYGKCQTNDNWNLQCMSSLTPKWTSVYNLIGHYVFFACVIISIISAVIYSVKHRHIKYCDKQYLYIVCPFIFECILRSAVFSFPFRAPPNDRYALIVYIVWYMVVLLPFVVDCMIGDKQENNSGFSDS